MKIKVFRSKDARLQGRPASCASAGATNASLEVVSREAELQHVRCETLSSEEPTPYGGIVAAAKRCGCDFIFMASHGRTGEPAAILGSVAQKVVQLAHVPVVVFRTP
jgi:nucleotide-binding universal stress UspA family protein